MNSRLRAYAIFLARHALSLAKSSKTDKERESVNGLEHKLETMLEIGSQVSSGSGSSDFIVDIEKLSEPTAVDGDDEVIQVSLPLTMKISVNIALPHVKEADGNESMKVSFETTGKLCGKFLLGYFEGKLICLCSSQDLTLSLPTLIIVRNLCQALRRCQGSYPPPRCRSQSKHA